MNGDFTDSELRAALRIVNDLQVRQAAEDLETASGWLAIAVCPEFGTRLHVGPIKDPVEAMAYAGHWADELNRDGDPEQPYTIEVVPVFDPSEMLL